jgi:oligopeptide/dipeptide ABC transporter ATP-binding protein
MRKRRIVMDKNTSSPLMIVKNLVKHYPLKAGGLSFSKNKIHAVNNISFNINKNETFGLVGESGCGKTTTARLLLKIIEPTNGQLYFDKEMNAVQNYENLLQRKKDRTIINKKELKKLNKEIKYTDNKINFFSYSNKMLKTERLKMQYIFQDPYMSLNPKMQIRDIITESLLQNKKINKNEINETAKYYMNIVGLSGNSLFKYPHEFSGGQRQRVNIARAIASKPKLIVCDEPVSALDVSVQSQILNLLIDIQNEFKVSYMFIAHNLSVVFYLCDKIAVMYAGKIVETASTKELYHNAMHPYTKLLISVAPKAGMKNEYYKKEIKGEVPNLINYPKGCPFYDRCPKRDKNCLNDFPELQKINDNHYCACFKII